MGEPVLTENYPIPKATINFISGALGHLAHHTRCTAVILPNTNVSDSHTNCQLTGERRQVWLAKKALSTLLTTFNPSHRPGSRFRSDTFRQRKRSRTPPHTAAEEGEIVEIHADSDQFID
jgi:hypothetical protein